MELATSITSLVFGLISLGIALVISSSQAIVICRTKNTSGTSIFSYIILTVCSTLCLGWALIFYFSRMSDWFAMMDKIDLWINQWAVIPIIIMYLFDITSGIFVIFLKSKHIRMARDWKISEMELAGRLIKIQQQNLAKTGKIYHRKYFPLVIFYISLFLFLVAGATCLTIFTNPNFVPEIGRISPDEQVMKPYIITLSVLGAFTWEAISWPQFIKCIKTKDTSGISMNWAIFLPISCLISFTYSFVLAFSPAAGQAKLATIGALIFNGIIVNIGILSIKIMNRRRARALHMTETEYTQKYLLKKEKRA